MKNYILVEHSTTWCKWENVKLSFDVKESHQEKSKKIFDIVTGPSQIILRVIILIRRMMHNNKIIMEDLLLLIAKAYMPIFIVENQWLRHLVMHHNSQVVFPN